MRVQRHQPFYMKILAVERKCGQSVINSTHCYVPFGEDDISFIHVQLFYSVLRHYHFLLLLSCHFICCKKATHSSEGAHIISYAHYVSCFDPIAIIISVLFPWREEPSNMHLQHSTTLESNKTLFWFDLSPSFSHSIIGIMHVLYASAPQHHSSQAIIWKLKFMQNRS